MSDEVTFSARVTFRVHPRFPAMYDQAAARLGMSTSEWLRAAAAKQLAFQGVDIASGQHIATDVTVWPEQTYKSFAVVEGGEVVATAHDVIPAGDSRTWLPILNADAQHFDARSQYREKPYLKPDGERVLRIYPIRNKADSYFASDL